VLANDRNLPGVEMERLMVARAVHSRRQLLEVLADFWHNHFNVYLYDRYAQSTFVSWDRDVIRPPVAGHPRPAYMHHGHMLGNFRKMLVLTSQHAAMQYYLDNYMSQVGGPNENYAREVLELHTLGAENYAGLSDPASIPKSAIPMPWGAGGADIMVSVADQYVDDDVYSAMRMLTGWKIKDRASNASSDYSDTAEPYFYEPWHDNFEKTILGHHWGNNIGAPADILQFFDLIAYHPGTARHIAGKLCRRFIGPNPPQAVIDAVAQTFYEHRYANDQLERTYRTLFTSSAFKDPANRGTILKRPMEAIISALRVCGSDWTPYVGDNWSWNIISYYMGRAGQRPFYRLSPDGFPQEASYWMGANSLLYVLRSFDWMADRNASEQDQAVMPLLTITQNASQAALPDHSPNRLAAFWLERILGYTPNGGWESTPEFAAIRDFTCQNPDDPSRWPEDVPFPDLAARWPYYIHERLLGLVKLVLSLPQFLHR
jgi:uncharacterized protein (DUF1800 family)